MLRIGLTGNIGTGKTTVADIFSVLGVPVFNADTEAKKLYSQNDILEKVKGIFGSNVVTDSGSADLKKIAELAFNDKEKLIKLNNLFHKKVFIRFSEWAINNKKSAYIIMESALLFETTVSFRFDKIIMVDAPIDLCLQRVQKRSGMTKADFEKRLTMQLKAEEKISYSDFIINNDEKTSLIKQVMNIHKKLLVYAG